jgi:hypothetical protein
VIDPGNFLAAVENVLNREEARRLGRNGVGGGERQLAEDVLNVLGGWD